MEERVTQAAVRRLTLENIRGFGHLELELGQSALIIGKNGTNKTTLLRAIALVLADLNSASALMTQPVGSYVRRPHTEASIGVTLSIGGEDNSWTRNLFQSGLGESMGVELRTERVAVPPVFAYGAGRGVVGGDSSRSLATDNFTLALSLFDYSHELDDPELTIRRLRDFVGGPGYEKLMMSFRRLLELDEHDQIVLSPGGGIVLSGPSIGGEIPLAGWADGHRLTLAWLLDLFGKAMQVGAIDAEGNMTGILLVDEIDQHLHPALQATMFPHLRDLLPEMQIIATTHSPLVALGADPADLLVLRKTDGEVVVDPSPRDYRGFTVEDMLSDDRLFDSPVMAPAAQEQLDRYQDLVAKGVSGRRPEEDEELVTLSAGLLAEPLPPDAAKDLDATIAEIRQRLSS